MLNKIGSKKVYFNFIFLLKTFYLNYQNCWIKLSVKLGKKLIEPSFTWNLQNS
jgi:hypothetical protein